MSFVFASESSKPYTWRDAAAFGTVMVVSISDEDVLPYPTSTSFIFSPVARNSAFDEYVLPKLMSTFFASLGIFATITVENSLHDGIAVTLTYGHAAATTPTPSPDSSYTGLLSLFIVAVLRESAAVASVFVKVKS